MTTLLSSRYWTEDAIIEAIQDWYEIHGHCPTQKEWMVGQPPYYPSIWTVRNRFGSANDAFVAAGFEPRTKGRPSHRPTREQLISLAVEAEVPVDVVLADNPDLNNGWFNVQKAKDVLKNAPDDPLRNLLWAILTGRRFAE